MNPPTFPIALLAPYLTEATQIAYQGLPIDEAQDYGCMKLPILDALDITLETLRQQNWANTYPLGAWPQVIAQEIKDLCWQWLHPEQWSAGEVAEQNTLEQFVHVLLPQGRAWVLRH